MRRFFVAGLALLLASVLACGDDSADSTSGGTTTQPRASATVNGPSAAVNPKSAPPGSEITISGSGWPAGTLVTLTAGTADAKPYATALTDQSGAFKKSFFIEKLPDGSALETGRLDLVITAGTSKVEIPFIVEVRRPVSGPGPGG